jgi:hypothetical protein
MATVQSNAVKSGVRVTPYEAGAVVCRSAKYAIPTGGLVANTIIEMVPVPAGAQIVDMALYCEADATSSLTFDVGDGTTVDLYFDGLNPQSAALSKTLWADGDTANFLGSKVYASD